MFCKICNDECETPKDTVCECCVKQMISKSSTRTKVLDLDDIPVFKHSNHTFVKLKDVEEIEMQMYLDGDVEETELFQSPKYGMCSEEKRMNVIKKFCKNNKISLSECLKLEYVDTFIDYGLIPFSTDLKFIIALKKELNNNN